MNVIKIDKTKAHTIYKTEDGKRVPGVTTFTGILAKPALIKWANNLGLQGIDSTKYVDTLADIGTLAHKLVECDLLNSEPDISEYSEKEIDLAENALISYYEWKRDKEIEVIFVEEPLVSEKYRFGGTCDIYAKVNGVKTLIDLKTSKAIYSEMTTQVSAYRHLLIENGKRVDSTSILRIGREESEGFEYHKCVNLDLHFDKFLHCLEIYNLNKRLK